MDEGLDPALAAVIAAIPEWDGAEPDVTPFRETATVYGGSWAMR